MIIKIHDLALRATSIVRAAVSLVRFAIYHLKILSAHSEVSSVSVAAVSKVSKAMSSMRFARQFPQVGVVDRYCMEGPGSTISDDSRFAPDDGILPLVVPNGSVVVLSMKFGMTLSKGLGCQGCSILGNDVAKKSFAFIKSLWGILIEPVGLKPSSLLSGVPSRASASRPACNASVACNISCAKICVVVE